MANATGAFRRCFSPALANTCAITNVSKQGNSLLRFLLVEAAQAAARIHPDWRRRYLHLAMRRHKSIAKVRWDAGWRLACTGCGGMDVRIRRR
jgi:hypothetical protein